MKKLYTLCAAAMLLLSINANANDKINPNLNLNNPDVRKCLIEASKSEGWKLQALYFNANEKLVMVFGKENKTKIYTSK